MIGWFLVPYRPLPRAEGPARTFAFNVDGLAALVEQANGTIAALELDRGVSALGSALCKVRAPQAVLDKWSKAYSSITNPGAVWTPTRSLPFSNDGSIDWTTTYVATRDWHEVDQEVFDDATFDSLRTLTDQYIRDAIDKGHVLLPTDMSSYMKSFILQRAGRQGFGLNRISPGTFPTNTTVVETFDGVDTDPLPGNWTTIGSISPLRRVGNLCAKGSGGTTGCMGRYTATTYGPDIEGYFTVSTVGGNQHDVLLRWSSAAASGYRCGTAVSDGGWAIRRWDAGTQTDLTTYTATPALVSGTSKVGGEVIGTTLKAYHYNGTSWSEIKSATDTTYTGSNYAGLAGYDDTWRVDNFVAGTVATAGPQTIGASGLASAEAIGTARILQLIMSTAIASAEAHGAARLALSAKPVGLASAEVLGTLTLHRQIRPSGAASGEAVGAPRTVLYLLPSGVASGEAHGAPALVRRVSPAAIGSLEAFGNYFVSRGDLFILPAAIGSVEAVGIPRANRTLPSGSIPSGEAIGAARMRLTLAPSGLTSAEVLGAARMILSMRPTPIGSAEMLGAVRLAQQIRPSGAGSSEALGQPTLNARSLLQPSGIGSGEIFGLDRLVLLLRPSGIGSGEAIGAPRLNERIRATGLASTTLFGTPVILPGPLTLVVSAIPGAESFGSPLMILGDTMVPHKLFAATGRVFVIDATGRVFEFLAD